jgi:hypothetical protein
VKLGGSGLQCDQKREPSACREPRNRSHRYTLNRKCMTSPSRTT